VITLWFAIIQDQLIYPPPRILARQSEDRRTQAQRIRSVRRFAPNLNARLSLRPERMQARLDDQPGFLINIENTGPQPFYFTTRRDPEISIDTSPTNFRLVIDADGSHCLYFRTFVDTVGRPTGQELLKAGEIALLMPGQVQVLRTQLHLKWLHLVCTPGDYRVRFEYDGIGIDGTFSHPFLTLPLISNWIEVSVEP
jgi:hypothetical protein